MQPNKGQAQEGSGTLHANRKDATTLSVELLIRDVSEFSSLLFFL